MKNKLYLICTTLLVIFTAFSLTACTSNNDGTDKDKQNKDAKQYKIYLMAKGSDELLLTYSNNKIINLSKGVGWENDQSITVIKVKCSNGEAYV